MDVSIEIVQLDVLLSSNERPSVMNISDPYSRLIIGSELLFGVSNPMILEDSIKEIMNRGR